MICYDIISYVYIILYMAGQPAASSRPGCGEAGWLLLAALAVIRAGLAGCGRPGCGEPGRASARPARSGALGTHSQTAGRPPAGAGQEGRRRRRLDARGGAEAFRGLRREGIQEMSSSIRRCRIQPVESQNSDTPVGGWVPANLFWLAGNSSPGLAHGSWFWAVFRPPPQVRQGPGHQDGARGGISSALGVCQASSLRVGRAQRFSSAPPSLDGDLTISLRSANCLDGSRVLAV